jgi:hypothetical protein
MDYATTVFPKPPQLFRGKGVTDDPASETYWKAANGIRLSGMPSFKTKLTETQLWQVSELLAHANEIPESVKRVLIPDSPTAASAPPLTRSSASTCCAWARSKLLSIDAHNFRRQDGHTCRKIATSLIDQRSKRVMAC